MPLLGAALMFNISEKEHMGLVARNLSLGFPTKRNSNQSPQLQILARLLKLYLW